jgi:transcriptional regulator with XRE-family HTH domain
MMALKDHIARERLSQSEAARLFGVTQPRISDLMPGKMDLFSLDTLVNILAAAGLHAEVHVSKAALTRNRYGPNRRPDEFRRSAVRSPPRRSEMAMRPSSRPSHLARSPR